MYIWRASSPLLFVMRSGCRCLRARGAPVVVLALLASCGGRSGLWYPAPKDSAPPRETNPPIDMVLAPDASTPDAAPLDAGIAQDALPSPDSAWPPDLATQVPDSSGGSDSVVGGWKNTAKLSHGMTDIWGSGPNDIYLTNINNALYHFDGKTWTPVKALKWGWLNSVWGSGPNNVYVVGSSGKAFHFNGKTWAATATGTSKHLYDVWGTGPGDVYAVGFDGEIRHHDGVAWSAMSSGTKETLWGVWGSDPKHVFAVGDTGTALFYDGSSWSPMKSGTNHTLTSVWGTGPTDVFAAGGFNTVAHYDGTKWSLTQVASSQKVYSVLFGVWGSGPSDVYVVGDSGVFNYDGSSWSKVVMPPSSVWRVDAVWGTGPKNIYLLYVDGFVVQGPF